MKKIISSLVVILMLVPCAFAYQAGGFYDVTDSTITVKQCLSKPDNSFVTMKGNIKKRLTSEEYLFTDKTADIVVEIDSEKWMGQFVGVDDEIVITGEVDRDFRTVKIDVDSVQVLKN